MEPRAQSPQRTAPATRIDPVDFQSYFRSDSHPTGSVIYRSGEPANRLYLLRSGRVRLLRPDSRKRTSPGCLRTVLTSGDFFGEITAGDSEVFGETAAAQGNCEVWSIESKDLRALLEARPVLGFDIIAGLSNRLRQIRRRADAVTFKDVSARVADALLQLGETLGEPGAANGETMLRGITQQDIADLVGASRSFVSTQVNEMKRDGLLRNVGWTLYLTNFEELKRRAAVEVAHGDE